MLFICAYRRSYIPSAKILFLDGGFASSFRYDYRAGFWGVMGHPCLGIISNACDVRLCYCIEFLLLLNLASDCAYVLANSQVFDRVEKVKHGFGMRVQQ
ncbi:hypothetical protein BHE74_00047456 [Ensete ventricosum]|nr:hypothetical protein BHE74_00047456 [Ensete ventricosum]